MGKVKHYATGELNVIWDPDKCIHSEQCVKGSPTVFLPDQKPWIRLDGADPDEVRRTIDKCPSGALSYEGQAEKGDESILRIKTVKNGPILLSCDLEIEDGEGEITRSNSATTALCRCGASSNKPFCDGSHKEAGFVG
ncbi:MAG: (4Fe-4S)-binding protein [Acidobacteriota bacterium]|nr:(4Fe-4S)-binding protein [Acidobacteriota bacterium]MDH3527962.1 (4Fe-4S)-binding protein [Acidobacteriota bacterium]